MEWLFTNNYINIVIMDILSDCCQAETCCLNCSRNERVIVVVRRVVYIIQPEAEASNSP